LRLLAVDVGQGTTDILVHEPGRSGEDPVKLVVPSRTQVVARQIRDATAAGRRVVFYGPTMGGGPSTAAMRDHLAAGLDFLATEQAGLTFADDLDRVRGHGVQLIGVDEVTAAVRSGATEVRCGDLDLPMLAHAFDDLGIDTRFDAGCVAVQDHGFNPGGSNRAFRFELWERALAARLRVDELFYTSDEIPAELTRMTAAARSLAALARVTAADTGPAALLGAMDDPDGDAVLVNAGNGHTICVVALGGRIAGVYEDHTRRLDPASLETLLRRFLAGDLPGDEVREAGGHGAALATPVPAGLPLLVTGPRRGLLAHSGLPVRFPTPYGDMMLTGPAGLVRAFERRFGV
jgi:uncharacterized protein (DUF1786 family)